MPPKYASDDITWTVTFKTNFVIFIFQLILMLVLKFVQLKFSIYAACTTNDMLKMANFYFSSGMLEYNCGPE